MDKFYYLFLHLILLPLFVLLLVQFEFKFAYGISNDLCPGKPSSWRFYNVTRKCYRRNSGHCGKFQIFSTIDHMYGDCTCSEHENGRKILKERNAKKCHLIFQQGPCLKGQWLTPSKTYRPSICSRNPCFTTTTSTEELYLYKGQCVKLWSNCTTSNSTSTIDSKSKTGSTSTSNVIQFIEGKFNVQCSSEGFRSYAVASGTHYSPSKDECPPGYLKIEKSCEKLESNNWDWD